MEPIEFICTSDFVMEDGEVCAVEGKFYQFTRVFDGWDFIDEQGDKHFLFAENVEECFRRVER